MAGLALAEMAILLIVLGGATAAIGVLCYVWMKSSRASQRRMEEHQAEMIRLLQEQNDLLRRDRQQPTIR